MTSLILGLALTLLVITSEASRGRGRTTRMATQQLLGSGEMVTISAVKGKQQQGDFSPCPTSCQCLHTALVTTCRSARLSAVPAVPTTSTRTLDLDHNAIHIVSNTSFVTVVMVKVISIRYNELTNIEAGAFRDLGALVEVRLSHNSLTSLPDRLFSTNRRLQIVDLRDNAFYSPPHTAFTSLTSLIHLDLAYNRLTTATLGHGLRSATRLKTIDLSGNNILTIDPDAFAVMSEWMTSLEGRSLNLSINDLRHIRRNAFGRLPPLSDLDLSSNRQLAAGDLVQALSELNVSKLHNLDLSDTNMTDMTLGRVFKREQWRHLSNLDLSANVISTVPNGAFHSLVNLKDLDLRHNRIKQPGDLDGLERLERLSLAYNKLETLTEVDFDSLEALKELDLSHNAIGQLTSEPFQGIFNIETLVLSNNRISTVTLATGLERLSNLDLSSNVIASDVTFARGLTSLRNLDLSNNSLTSLATPMFTDTQSLSVVNLSANVLTDIATLAFGGARVMSLDLSRNDLDFIHDVTWPGGLVGLNLAHNHLTNVSAKMLVGLHHVTDLDLSGNRLTSLPRDMARYTPELRELNLAYNALGGQVSQGTNMPFNQMITLQHLLLAGNSITSLPPTLFSSSGQLQMLDISHNTLQSLPVGALANLHQLQYIDISYNRLNTLDPAVFSPLTALRLVDISHNPWSCTCTLAQFHRWLQSPHTAQRVSVAALRRPGAYTCEEPPTLRGTPIIAWAGPNCSLAPPPLSVILLMGGACVVIVLIAVCVGLLCHVTCTRRKLRRHHGNDDKAKYSSMRESPPCTVQHNITTSSRLWL